jgi:hypothetical protein
MAESISMTTLDTTYHKRRHAALMQDAEFRREYELAQAQIDQVDAVALGTTPNAQAHQSPR